MTAKVLLISNTAWNIYNFRRGLIRELQQHGYAVVAVAPPDQYGPRIAETGARYIPLPMDNSGTNPWKDLRLCLSMRRLFKTERPSCILTFTIKPNLYGAVAARSLGIPTISNISGLGTVFIKRNWVTTVARSLYRAGLRVTPRVFFQNPDDRDYFVSEGLVSLSKAYLLPGSGVDTSVYRPATTKAGKTARFRFLLLGRIIGDKGVCEYVEAAALVRKRHPDCEFALMGFVDVLNTTAITMAMVREWEGSGLVTYLPPVDDVRPELAKTDCVVLPSYREGTPKALLEAASMGKPIIATDVPGCRQVVEDGRTGFLVNVRDATDLAHKMERMIDLSESERQAMGLRGREKMVREFEERIVLDRYIETVHELTNRGKAGHHG